jgi:hypothetical protein
VTIWKIIVVGERVKNISERNWTRTVFVWLKRTALAASMFNKTKFKYS